MTKGLVGIGKPVSKEHGADHVLSKFGKRDRTEVDVTLEELADILGEELELPDILDKGKSKIINAKGQVDWKYYFLV